MFDEDGGSFQEEPSDLESLPDAAHAWTAPPQAPGASSVATETATEAPTLPMVETPARQGHAEPPLEETPPPGEIPLRPTSPRAKRVRLQKKTPPPGGAVPEAATGGGDPLPEASFRGHPALRQYRSRQARDGFAIRKRYQAYFQRLQTKLERDGVVDVGSKSLTYSDADDWEACRRALRRLGLLTWASDSSRELADRGYAMHVLLQKESERPAATITMGQRGQSCFVTYNGPWAVLRSDVYAGRVPETCGIQELSEVVQNSPRVLELASDFRRHVTELQEKGSLRHYAYSFELCPKTWSETRVARLHVHLWFLVGTCAMTKDALLWRTGYPHEEKLAMQALGMSRQGRGVGAQWSGAFYVSVPKIGQI
ncbi:MAG: hypothetical protein GY772_26925, partial [bacterium]|nr:hypothetical protein [bacterium]